MDHRPASARTASTPVLVTGATGYVGGRLVPGLLRAGFRVRVLVRDPERLRRAPWRSEVEVVCGNVLDPQSLPMIAALRVEASAGQIVEIGGTDVLTYAEMLAGYAHARRLRRWLIPVPVLTPRLSAYWVHWMTPCPADIARPLVEGLRSEVVVRDDRARALFPWIAPIGYAEAVRLALADLEAQQVETSWSDPLASSEGPRPDARLVSHAGTRVVLCHLGLAAARSVGPPRRRGGGFGAAGDRRTRSSPERSSISGGSKRWCPDA
jgi:hypothetical protein